MAIGGTWPWEGAGGTGAGAATANAVSMLLTGITVDLLASQAVGGAGGHGGVGSAFGGNRGDATVGGNGFTGTGGDGGDGGGVGGEGLGGGIWSAVSSRLTIDPRLGAKKGSKQSKAVDSITLNQASLVWVAPPRRRNWPRRAKHSPRLAGLAFSGKTGQSRLLVHGLYRFLAQRIIAPTPMSSATTHQPPITMVPCRLL